MSEPLSNDDTIMADQLSKEQPVYDLAVQNCETPELQPFEMSEALSNDDIGFMIDQISVEPTKGQGVQNSGAPEPQYLQVTKALSNNMAFMMDEDISFSQYWEMTSSQPHQMSIPFPDDFEFMLGQSTMEQEANIPVLQSWELPRPQNFQNSNPLLDDALFTMNQLSMDHLNDEPLGQGQEIPKPQLYHTLDPLPDGNEPMIDQQSLEKLRKIPFAQKWDVLKPTLENLYLHQGKKLQCIMEFMKAKYHFDANLTQYKYQFGKKWSWKKNIPAAKKTAILELGQQRATLGKQSITRFKGKVIDPRKLRRHNKLAFRQELVAQCVVQRLGSRRGLFSVVIPFKNRRFLSWSVPIGAGAVLNSGRPRSSFTANLSNPSDVSIHSLTGDSEAPVNEGKSLFSRALEQKVMMDRLQLFIRGEHVDLARSMNRSEIRTMSIWLHQFWFFAFKIAKNWRYGPIDLKAEDLGFLPNQELGSINSTESSSRRDHIQKPSMICYWAQHSSGEPEYYEIPTPLEEILRTNIETNDFSSYSISQLSLELPQFAKTFERSPSELLEESLGFAIMAGNIDLICNVLTRVVEQEIDISKLYPYHLAATYLYGCRDCCNIFDLLSRDLELTDLTLMTSFVNDRGHTIIDSLMITVLRSHTSTRPGMVDSAWSHESRFPGEEIDICGRWDPESSCYRALLAAGEHSVPFHWKHKFCHTSAQAIFHCLRLIRIYLAGWGFSQPSGLFIEYCPPCGKRLTLLPLHTLVMVAFRLVYFGFEDEDLFGIITCLMVILTNERKPDARTEVSVNLLLKIEGPHNCDHKEMSPLELAKAVQKISIEGTWSASSKVGWEIMCHILQQAEKECRMRNDSKNGCASQQGSYDSKHWEDDCSEGDEDGWWYDFSKENGEVVSVEEDEDDTIEEEEGVSREEDDFSEERNGNDGIMEDLDAENVIDENRIAKETIEECVSGPGFSWGTPVGTALGSPDGCRPSYTLHDGWCYEAGAYFGHNKYLGHIMAAIQVELLTYRRIRVTDPWLSKRFNMDELLQNFESGSRVSIELVRTGIMTPYCSCGAFRGPVSSDFPTADEVTKEDISNMDWEDEHGLRISLPPTFSDAALSYCSRESP